MPVGITMGFIISILVVIGVLVSLKCVRVLVYQSEFVDYVLSFYGEGGIYPMGATVEMIEESTERYMKILELKEEKFCADSIDRECVRDLMISKYKLRPV